MSKKIESPIKRWAGSVTIADPLTIPQAQLIENGVKPVDDAEMFDGLDGKKRYYPSVTDKTQIPAILACVEKWELINFPENVTLENFPASPRGDSHKLIEWIFLEILKVYNGELDIPNE